MHLRGERRLAPVIDLSFDYRLAGAESLRIELVHAKTKRVWRRELTKLTQVEWAKAAVRFDIPEAQGQDAWADELRFYLPPGSGTVLSLDDVLLYEADP